MQVFRASLPPPSLSFFTKNVTTTAATTASRHTARTKADNMTVYDILITSDIVCPWCYIGHTRLSRAIEHHKVSYPDDVFNLKYRPFYLNPPPQVHDASQPAFPIPSTPRREYYAAKFGASHAEDIFRRLDQVAQSEGLHFKFGGHTGSSRNGHRLVHYAQTHGGETSQNDVMMGLWKRYFEQEVDITQLDVLVQVGVEAGLATEAELKDFLLSGKDAQQVDRLALDASEDDITGVPHYLIQNKWAVGGAQEPRAFEALFKRFKSQEAAEGATAPGAGENGHAKLDRAQAC